jgi:broad-specificity NMP kinase
VIIWLNGTFGVGKTTVANRLVARRGHRVRHVVLDADAETLRTRIDADPEGHDIRGWRHDHIEAYLVARPWLLQDADLVLDTSTLPPEEAADKTLDAFPVDLAAAEGSSR